MSGNHNSLLDSILRALGFNPTQLRWRWRRRKQAMSNWWKRTENRSRAARYEHKTCHACNAPVDKDEKVCPRCGAALSGARVERASRLLSWILPEGGMVYTTLIGIVIVAVFGAMIAKGGAAMLWPQSREAVQEQVRLSLQLGADSVSYWTLDVPQVWRLVTSMFVHFGLMHFLFNIYALMQLGPMLEEVYGRSKFFVLYFLCGVGGSIISLWWHWDKYPTVSAGASGALFGLIGASLVYGWRTGGALGRSLTSEMLRWGVFALLFAFIVNADNAAHLGGAAVGASLAMILPDGRAASKLPEVIWPVLELICLLAVIGSFVALFAFGYDYEGIHNALARLWPRG